MRKQLPPAESAALRHLQHRVETPTLKNIIHTPKAACPSGWCWPHSAGVTTNESFKRREYLRALRLQRELDMQRAKQDAITDRILGGGSGGGEAGAAGPGAAAAGGSAGAAGASGSCRGAEPDSQPRKGHGGGQAQQEGLPNPYNRGPWRNLHEVLFPWHHLRMAQAVGALHKDE